jgi:hypothetical protein
MRPGAGSPVASSVTSMRSGALTAIAARGSDGRVSARPRSASECSATAATVALAIRDTLGSFIARSPS